jgi:hypothetical protein
VLNDKFSWQKVLIATASDAGGEFFFPFFFCFVVGIECVLVF